MFVLASRRSLLALRQSEIVADALRRVCGVQTKIVGFSTRGDETAGALAEAGGKDLFLDRPRRELQAGRAGAAVHSLKDIPAAPNADFVLAAVGFAEDARDAVVSRGNVCLKDLPAGAAVGTSGPRRAALLRRYFPKLRVVAMRGNIHTRLEKLQSGECDALLLAAAGLNRMGLQNHIAELLPPEQFIPAVGQGLLAVECAANNPQSIALLAKIGDAAATSRAAAERAFAAAMNGDCHTPLGALAKGCAAGTIKIRAFHAAPNGDFYETQAEHPDAQTAGQQAAENIKQQAK